MVNYKRLVIIGFAILFLDQLTKQLVKINSIFTSGHLIDITYTTNEGTLFSLFSGTSLINWVFILFSLVALATLWYLLKNEHNKTRQIAYAIIGGGILGNLIDRLIYGFVIDWVNFHFWPIFNMADSALMVGVIIAIYTLIIEKEIKN